MQRFTWQLTLIASLATLSCGVPEGGELDADPALSTQQAELVIGPVKPIENLCGNRLTQPQIFSNDLMHPQALLPGGIAPPNWNPDSGRITRGGIHYVSSNGLRFEMVTDRCTYIKEVKIGSQVVTPQYTNGYWFSAQASTNQPGDPNRYGTNLWIFYPPQPDGRTDTVTITVGRQLGSGVATYSFPMVQVDSVEARNVRASMGFSRSELMNMFATSLYAMFNGAQNSAVLTSSDGSKRRIYGYDPSTLSLSVTPTGVGFQFKFKTDINNWCDPTVRAYGTFKLNADPSGLSVAWVNQATASLDWPFLCEAIQVVPILGLIPNLVYGIIEDRASASVLGAVTDSINDSLPGVGDGRIFLDGSTTRSGELLVHLNLPVPSISLRVPYDAFDMARGGTLFPAGENLTLVASGLGTNESAAGGEPGAVLSGPNGIARFGSTDFPRAQTVARSGFLVWNQLPVSRLLARQSSLLRTTTYQYEPGCTLKTVSPFHFDPYASVRFGVNDTAADAQRLRGIFGAANGFDLRVLFLNDLSTSVGDGSARCASNTSGPVIVQSAASANP